MRRYQDPGLSTAILFFLPKMELALLVNGADRSIVLQWAVMPDEFQYSVGRVALLGRPNRPL